jgi:hypothetical protein
MILKLGRVVPVFAVACVFAVAILGILTQSLRPLVLITLLPATVVVMMKPDWLAVAAVMLSAAHLTIPSLAQRLTVNYILGALFVGSAIARGLVRRTDAPREGYRVSAALFLMVVGITAAARGLGLRALGGDLWGGMPYVQIGVTGAMLLLAWRVRLSAAQWSASAMGLCVLALLPMISNILNRFEISSFLTAVVRTSFDDDVQAMSLVGAGQDAINRLHSANVAGEYMFLLALMLCRGGPVSRLGSFLVLLAGGALVGVSGHRIVMIYGLVSVVVFGLLNHKATFLKRVASPGVIGMIVAFGLLVGVMQWLPPAFQRALSWLPFAEVSSDVRVDAAGTLGWRLSLWERAFEEVHRYFWLGKGFAFSAKDMLSFVHWSMQDLDYVMLSRNYHNGLLALMIELGVAGFLAGIAFIGLFVRAQWRRSREPWASPALHDLHRAFLACFVAQVGAYVVLAGGTTTFATLFLWAFVMVGLGRSDEALTRIEEDPSPGGRRE